MVETMLKNKMYQECIEVCFECAEICERCDNECLSKSNTEEMNNCLTRDCADICNLAGQFMSRDSEFATEICSICSEICKECKEECSKHSESHFRDCVEVCNRCSIECKTMAE